MEHEREYYVRFQAAGILTTGFYLVVLYIVEATICAAFTQMQQTISRRSLVHFADLQPISEVAQVSTAFAVYSVRKETICTSTAGVGESR